MEQAGDGGDLAGLAAASLESGAIFDLRTGRQIGHPSAGECSRGARSSTPDGAALVISGFFHKDTRTYDPDTGEQVGGVITDAFRAANGPSGTLLTSNQSGTARLVDFATREQVDPRSLGCTCRSWC
jgi:hypothetical protein